MHRSHSGARRRTTKDGHRAARPTRRRRWTAAAAGLDSDGGDDAKSFDFQRAQAERKTLFTSPKDGALR